MRVLVVEDHVDTAEAVSMLLTLAGHDVEVVSSGEAAVAAAQVHSPDVVLLDLGLPGMDGWQVARHVQEQPAEKRPLLVAVSGRASEEDQRRSAEAGIDLHLVKPVDPAQLQHLLARFRRVIEEPKQSA
jgi:DNA-binding response OmpR family regulator